MRRNLQNRYDLVSIIKKLFLHIWGGKHLLRGFLPYATFRTRKKVALAKNRIRKISALTKLIVHKNRITKFFSNGFEKPQ